MGGGEGGLGWGDTLKKDGDYDDYGIQRGLVAWGKD